MKFLNCTQHGLTPEQIDAIHALNQNGKIVNIGDGYTVAGMDLHIDNLRDVAPELFAQIANTGADANLAALASDLLKIVNRYDYAHLPVGSPAFMFQFAQLSAEHYDGGQGVWHKPLDARILFSHSVRESVEETQPDGTVTKKSVFRFERFI